MKRRQLVLILVSILVIILILTGILVKIGPKERYERKYLECKDLCMEKLYQGYDLSEVEDVAKKAKEAYNKGDYESAMGFLDEAIIALERAKKAAPIMLPVTWTEEEYTEYFIQNFLNLALPPLTKEQIQQVISDKNLKKKTVKGLKNAQEYYADKNVETIKLGSLAGEIEKALEAVSNVTNSITRLRKDVNAHKDIEVIHADYNMLRLTLIQEYQVQQELRKKFEPVYDTFIRKYRPEEYHPMKFSVTANTASYWGPAWKPTEEIVEEIDLLSELLVDSIRFDLMFDVWQQNEDVVDVIVEEIRNNGKDVYIAFYGGETWRDNPYSWADFKNVYLENLERAVRKYQPEYVNLLGEAPDFNKPMVKEHVPEEEWVGFVEECAKAVKTIKPDCFVIVDTIPHPDGDKFFNLLMSHENKIDAIGIDPYSLKELVERGEYALTHWTNKDKELWIGQTWENSHGKYFYNVSEKFIIGSVYWAERNDMKGYCLFFGHRLHTKDFEPTPAFFTYKMVIEEVHNNTIST